MIPALASVIPQAEPLPFPAPVWLLWGLLLLTFFLHLVAMNLLVGGGVLAADTALRRGGSAHRRRAVSIFARALPVLIAATVTLGVAPLLFLQVLYGRLFFVSSILMAWAWLAVVPILLAVYYGGYALAGRARRGVAAPAVAYVAVVGGILVVGFILATNMSLMLRPDRFAAIYAAGAGGFHLNLDDPTIWPRWLHAMLGAVAVGGLALALAGFRWRSTDAAFADWARRHGARWAASATAANVLVGAWWIAMLQPAVLDRFLSGHLGHLLLLAAAIGAGVGAFVLLAALARPLASPPVAVGAAGTLAVTIALMVLVRDAVRTATLEVEGFVPQAWVVPQWPAIALFAVLLVVAIALVVWMAWMLARAPRPAPAR